MQEYRIDPEYAEQEELLELNETFELYRVTAEYDPAPCLEDEENDDCRD